MKAMCSGTVKDLSFIYSSLVAGNRTASLRSPCLSRRRKIKSVGAQKARAPIPYMFSLSEKRFSASKPHINRSPALLSDGKDLFRLFLSRVLDFSDVFICHILDVLFGDLQVVLRDLALFLLRLESIHRVASYRADRDF